MLNIGNKKLKDDNIGTTPLDSIYLGSTLIWRKEYVQWYDPEFKRVILEKYNNGKEMTQDQLNKITSLDPNLFAYNKKLLSIKDLEKFINITILPKQLCMIPIFQGWFQKCNIKSFAPSKEQLEDTKIKLPEGITEITPLAFSNSRLNNFSVYIPNSVIKISGLFARKNSTNTINTNIKLLDIGSGCKYIQGDSGISNNNNYTIICRAINPPLLTIGSNIYKDNIVGYSFALYKCYPFNCDVKHIYVPDESVDLYKNDNKYGIQEQYSDEITEHTGTVECFDYDFTGIKERNISWSRFKDIIKPLSEYVES